MNLRKKDPLLKIMNNALVDMPAPANISSWWNFGSLLGLCLLAQIGTGLLLSLHYLNSLEAAFNSVVHICRDVNHGWLLRSIHANGASSFFVCLYLHTGRGLYYGSFLFKKTWSVGVMIMLLVMATAFLGYVLPWGQMSFWGATVITNLLSTVPYVGTSLVQWLWGGYAVDSATLTRFFAFHFLLPFILSALVLVHILFLHQTGSNNPLGVASSSDKVPFHPYYTFKDSLGFSVFLLVLLMVTLTHPNLMSDPENFTPANPLSTPPHIQPEWYYLFAYAILRAIPNKLGGVVALISAILILLLTPSLAYKTMRSNSYYPVNQMLFWSFFTTVLLLTWAGARPVEEPYIVTSQVLTLLYFSYFFLDPLVGKSWDSFTK